MCVCVRVCACVTTHTHAHTHGFGGDKGRQLWINPHNTLLSAADTLALRHTHTHELTTRWPCFGHAGGCWAGGSSDSGARDCSNLTSHAPHTDSGARDSLQRTSDAPDCSQRTTDSRHLEEEELAADLQQLLLLIHNLWWEVKARVSARSVGLGSRHTRKQSPI